MTGGRKRGILTKLSREAAAAAEKPKAIITKRKWQGKKSLKKSEKVLDKRAAMWYSKKAPPMRRRESGKSTL